MIASLRGAVSAIALDSFVLDVGGVGYLVNTSPQTLSAVRTGQEVLVHTELVVREDSMTIYGFLTKDEADLFRTIQSVSGIGPRIAIAVLAVMDPATFARAVLNEDLKTLTSVPGIGKKGAQRMTLELKDKVAPFAAGTSECAAPVPSAPETNESSVLDSRAAKDVVQGLQGLGWPEKGAKEAVEAVLLSYEESEQGSSASLDSGVLLRLSLRQLGGRS